MSLPVGLCGELGKLTLMTELQVTPWKLRCMYLLKDVVNAPRLRWKEGHHGGRGVVVMGAPP